MKIYVIGYLGSNRASFAKNLSQEKGYDFFDMDREIEKIDGRSVKRICMMMGEHEYRNKEYELLAKWDKMDNIVVACGDGVFLDNMSFDLLKKGHIIFLEEDIDMLWERAKQDETIPYAFMHTLPLEEKHKKFVETYEVRKHLYKELAEEKND